MLFNDAEANEARGGLGLWYLVRVVPEDYGIVTRRQLFFVLDELYDPKNTPAASLIAHCMAAVSSLTPCPEVFRRLS